MSCQLRLVLALSFLLVPMSLKAFQSTSEESIRGALAAHAVPLRGAGEERLLAEARDHDFFLLGELHGETEIPSLLRDLWPELWQIGYHHVAAEVSPWAAEHLERNEPPDATPIVALWTYDQAAMVRHFAAPDRTVLWGCDIDESQPQRLILDIAALNPGDAGLQQMVKISGHGYNRAQASELLRIADADHPAHDAIVGGISLWQNVRDTLRIETLRSSPATKLAASEARELLMKRLFLAHYEKEGDGKVLLRFGRNHLHRGYDARGVSTLGNFVTEWALAKNKSVFNVGVFAAGGKEHLPGETFDADERKDELTFALLANLAGSNATLFDLRPLRPLLHAIASGKRTPLEANLVYWADSYDFLLCYPTVSPLAEGGGVNQ